MFPSGCQAALNHSFLAWVGQTLGVGVHDPLRGSQRERDA